MPCTTLSPDNFTALAESWDDDTWVVACLCAAWCDVCKQYKPEFEQLAERHPDKRFLWIDIEDCADLMGDFDVENFPTLLMQHGEIVAFYGTVLPGAQQANRLIQAQAEKTAEELQTESRSNSTRRDWQQQCNLRTAVKNFAASE